MGTSSSNKGTRGRGTPLVPSWLEPDTADSASPDNDQNEQGSVPPSQAPSPPPPVPHPADPDRFRAPRANFTRFVRSGGNDRGSLGRAVSGYVTRASGGPRRAAQSMGSSRRASARLLGFLFDTASRGVEETLRSLHLEQLAARPIEEIFLGLIDYICPEAGTGNAGIARDAFTKTIEDLATWGITDLGSLNLDQIQTVFELYATHAIEERLYNDIGTNVITLPPAVSQIENIQEQLRDYIRGAVMDALAAARSTMETLTPDRTLAFVDSVYEQTFSFLVELDNPERESS